MKAPEKIYIDDFGSELSHDWHTEHSYEKDIEYVRIDTFVNKACEYFYRCLEDTKVTDDYRNTVVPGIQAIYTSVEEFVEDFKNYIKA